MKRIVLSLAGGILLPFSYAILLGPVSLLTEDESLRWLFGMPIRWPAELYFEIWLWSGFSFSVSDEAFMVLIVGCNVLLYGFLTYCALLLLSLRRNQAKPNSPPLPPVDFETQ